jgi:hypothetical protein
MTYRRDPSDIELIARQPARHDRQADTVVRRVGEPGMQPPRTARPAVSGPVAHHDVSFAAPPRRPQALDASPLGRGPSPSPSPLPTPSANNPDVILVKSGFRQVATRVGEIVFVKAARNYVRIHLESGQVLKSRVPIDRLGLHLGRQRFLRVHRGCLVNVDRIRGVTPLLGGRLLLSLADGSTVTVARDRRRTVLAEIGAGSSPR